MNPATKRLVLLVGVGVLAPLLSCGAKPSRAPAANQSTQTSTSSKQSDISWPSNPFAPGELENEELKRAWDRFESMQPYRLATPADRKLSPAAVARVNSNSANQVIPFISWWGVRGLQKTNDTDVLVAIVVDPSRTDPKRYGLVVFAAPVSEGPEYKVYWVLREQDLESYLLSPASGSVFIEAYRRDGTDEIKELAWDGKSKMFRLK